MKNVVVLGATPKADRFAYRAMQMLKQYGHKAIPVNPAFPEVLGEACHKSIADVAESIDTVTMYVGEKRSDPLVDEIVNAQPRRIILNPGAENDRLEAEAKSRSIEVVHGCTLVMLQTDSF